MDPARRPGDGVWSGRGRWAAAVVVLGLLGIGLLAIAHYGPASPADLDGVPSPARTYHPRFQLAGLPPPGSREIAVTVEGGVCENVPEGRTKLDGVAIVEEGPEAVTLLATATEGPNPDGECLGVGEVLFGTVTLTQPLGSRTVLDASEDPPRQVRRPDRLGPKHFSEFAARLCRELRGTLNNPREKRRRRVGSSLRGQVSWISPPLELARAYDDYLAAVEQELESGPEADQTARRRAARRLGIPACR